MFVLKLFGIQKKYLFIFYCVATKLVMLLLNLTFNQIIFKNVDLSPLSFQRYYAQVLQGFLNFFCVQPYTFHL